MQVGARIGCLGTAAVAALLALGPTAKAAESGFTIYPLGSLAFGSGSVAPPGLYVTPVAYYYQGRTSAALPVSGVTAVDVEVSLFSPSVNLTWSPHLTLLGGQPAVTLGLPAGYIDLAAQAVGGVAGQQEVSGWGGGQISGQVQLGWTHGDLSHMVALTGWAPTGRYAPGFQPSISLNRPALDVTWGATWTPAKGWEISGAVGVVFNAENDITRYKTGDEFHAEGIVAHHFANGWAVGLAGYAYRQLTGDSGPGATFGPFEGRIWALGPALGYATEVAGRAVMLNARTYWEQDARHRFEGTTSFITATVRF